MENTRAVGWKNDGREFNSNAIDRKVLSNTKAFTFRGRCLTINAIQVYRRCFALNIAEDRLLNVLNNSVISSYFFHKFYKLRKLYFLLRIVISC